MNKFLVMVILNGGLFVVGKMNVGVKEIDDPRVFSVIDNGKRIQLAPLPGVPISLRYENCPSYIIENNEVNRSLFDLYEKVTTEPKEESKEESKIKLV